jgi:hypothetical protein
VSNLEDQIMVLAPVVSATASLRVSFYHVPDTVIAVFTVELFAVLLATVKGSNNADPELI